MDIFEKDKEEIRDLYRKDKITCLNKCTKLLHSIMDVGNFNIKYFCHYFIARVFYDLDQYEQALKHAKIAKSYTETITDRMRIHWLISYFSEKYDINKAIEFLEYALKDACEIESEENIFGLLVHKAFLTNNEELMIDAINNLIRLGVDDNRLDLAYKDLFIMYYEKNELLKAQIILKKIKNKNIKNELSNKIYNQYYIGVRF